MKQTKHHLLLSFYQKQKLDAKKVIQAYAPLKFWALQRNYGGDLRCDFISMKDRAGVLVIGGSGQWW